MMSKEAKKQTTETNDNLKEEFSEIPIEIISPDAASGEKEQPESKDQKTDAEEKTAEPTSESEKTEDSAGNAQQYLEQLQRLQAEFQNYKRRIDRERQELSKYVKAEFIRNLLPVVDDFNRFIDNHQDSDFMDGFQLIHDKMMNVFKEAGLEPIKASGETFDPNFHDALYMQEVEQDTDDGKVLEEWEKGFLFQGTLLRPAKVKVGKKKSNA